MKTCWIFTKFISLLLVLCCVGAVGMLTVFAEPEDGDTVVSTVESAPGEDQQSEQQNQPDPEHGNAEQPQDTPSQPEPQDDQQAEQPADNQIGWDDVYEPIQEYIYGNDGWDSTYSEPEHLSELPEANPGEVKSATAVVIPDVGVSDASMFSGIVMWLCVALGIAVVVGVLVSKRTRRRG